VSNVPKLRFKEFDEEWHENKLNKYLSFNNGINAPKEAYGYGRKFINVLDILNNDFILYKNIIGSVSVSPKIEEANKVEYGDVLFLRSSETREDVGKSTVYLEEKEYALFGGFVIRGKNKGNYNPYFLKLNLESPKTRYQIGSRAGGSTRFNVSQSVLNSIEVKMPCLAEQQKIADYFLLMEKKIKNQQRKIELLKEQKKGYMQKIFNRELRFKDENGKVFPEWRKSIFAKILKIPHREKEEKPTKEKLLTVKLHLKGIAVSENIATLKIGSTTYYKRKAGQFIYGKQNLFNGAFGIIPKELDGFLSSGDIPVLDFKEDHIEPMYFYYYLSQWEVYKRLESISSGTGSKRIHERELLKEKIYLPCIEEQHKIVGLLRSSEKKINIEESRLELMINQKKGYMQQMYI